MSEVSLSNTDKKLVKIDIVSDTVCPWCYVGKKNLDSAMLDDRFEYEINWHPYQLNPSAPLEGVNKREFYRGKFGSQSDRMEAQMSKIYSSLNMNYDMSGLTGNTFDSHRLIYYAGLQGSDKQHRLVEELFNGYQTRGKYIGDKNFLLDCADKVGIEGAAEFLEDKNNGKNEVEEERKKYSREVTGVPYMLFNGKYKMSGAQPVESFKRAFEAATAP